MSYPCRFRPPDRQQDERQLRAGWYVHPLLFRHGLRHGFIKVHGLGMSSGSGHTERADDPLISQILPAPVIYPTAASPAMKYPAFE